MSKNHLKYPPYERPVTWLALLGIGYAGVQQNVWSVAAFAFLAGCLYELFLVPTQCAAATTRDTPCGENTRGRLRACWRVSHKRKKRDAIWHRVTERRNPFARHRKIWGDTQIDHGAAVRRRRAGEVHTLSAEQVPARFTIALTVVSTIAAVISAAHDLLT